MTLAAVPAATACRQPANPASIPLKAAVGALFALFALDNVLLLGFLGLPAVLVAALALILPSTLTFMVSNATPEDLRIDCKTILFCSMAAALLLILGGEGRLLYATPDWQIRDAVLADMGRHQWPFDYWLDGKSQLLRAPVGMYLVPALVGKGSQLIRDWALFAHNCFVLALIFALASILFENGRTRIIAFAVFVAFSGLDVIGNLIRQTAVGTADWDHIERWSGYYQFSSHITQIFWVPQHAFAGWTVALIYLLWRRKLIPIGILGASMVLTAIWSPLALMGAVPFAIFAGIRALLTGAWNNRDVLLCMLAVALAIPALLYLLAGAREVGSGFQPLSLIPYILLMLLEAVPFLFPLLRDRTGTTDRATIAIASLCLFLMPLWSVGASNDFQMRASIMPLALVAVAFAEWMASLRTRLDKACALVIIALGSVTGAVEVERAFRFASSPVPHCSLIDVWHRQTGTPVPYVSYFAARENFPFPIIPVDRISAVHPEKCWDRPWTMPRRAAVLTRQDQL